MSNNIRCCTYYRSGLLKGTGSRAYFSSSIDLPVHSRVYALGPLYPSRNQRLDAQYGRISTWKDATRDSSCIPFLEGAWTSVPDSWTHEKDTRVKKFSQFWSASGGQTGVMYVCRLLALRLFNSASGAGGVTHRSRNSQG